MNCLTFRGLGIRESKYNNFYLKFLGFYLQYILTKRKLNALF
jgi:hypothetical protein